MRRQQDRLLNLHLASGLDDAQFPSRTLSFATIDRGAAEKAEIAMEVFKLSQSLPQKWLKADYTEKRQMVEMVCLNLVLKGTNLCIAKRKPFNALVEGLKMMKSGGGGHR